MSTETLIAFASISALLCIVPGPDNIFVLVKSALLGKRKGIFITLGLCSGLVVHTSAVAFGVAAFVQISEYAFSILKYCGAIYLLYLGWQSYKAEPPKVYEEKLKGNTNLSLYVRGIIMNISNPKVTIFFLAFLPQFATHGNDDFIFQIYSLGLVFIIISFLIFSFFAVLSGLLSGCLNSSDRVKKAMNKITAFVFFGLAFRLINSSKDSI